MNVHCFYCGVLTTTDRKSGKARGNLPNNFRTKDHMTPTSRGGAPWSFNTVYCCDKCNRHKGCLTYDEFRAVVAYRKGLVSISAAKVFAGEKFPKAIFGIQPNKTQKLEIVLDNCVGVVVVFILSSLIPALTRHT